MRDLLKGIDVKAKIVEEDERESNIRQYLNFGHTLGHALESVLGYGKITHGEAIAIGMLFAMRVSEILYKIKLPYDGRSEEHTSELQSRGHIVCRLLLEKTA